MDETCELPSFDLHVPDCALILHSTKHSLKGQWKGKDVVIFDASSNQYDYQIIKRMREEIIENMNKLENVQQKETLQILVRWFNKKLQLQRLKKITALQLRNL